MEALKKASARLFPLLLIVFIILLPNNVTTHGFLEFI